MAGDETNDLHVLAHHGNHEIEETDGLNECETENGVLEELTTHGWVASHGHDESSEDETDTDTGTSETNGGGTHTHVLGDLDHGIGDLRGVGARLLGESNTVEDGDLLTLEGGEGRGGLLEALGDTRVGTLGAGLNVGADHWAGDLGGSRAHDLGHLGGNHSRGHCDGDEGGDGRMELRRWRWENSLGVRGDDGKMDGWKRKRRRENESESERAVGEKVDQAWEL